MELHKDQVPAREVWAVRIENSFGGDDITWFITADGSNDDYQAVTSWWEGPKRLFEDQNVAVSRWYVELPRQRMDIEDVDAWVEFVIRDEETGPMWRRRLDIKRFQGATAKR